MHANRRPRYLVRVHKGGFPFLVLIAVLLAFPLQLGDALVCLAGEFVHHNGGSQSWTGQ